MVKRVCCQLRLDSWLPERRTPTADTNEPGSRRIEADQRKRSAQAMDGMGHAEQICKQRFSRPAALPGRRWFASSL